MESAKDLNKMNKEDNKVLVANQSVPEGTPAAAVEDVPLYESVNIDDPILLGQVTCGTDEMKAHEELNLSVGSSSSSSIASHSSRRSRSSCCSQKLKVSTHSINLVHHQPTPPQLSIIYSSNQQLASLGCCAKRSFDSDSSENNHHTNKNVTNNGNKKSDSSSSSLNKMSKFAKILKYLLEY